MTKILIVDDDEQVIALYSDVLSKEGFEVLTSTNGKDVLRLAVQEVPSLILLDMVMPEVDGADVLDSLLRNEKTRDIPVIFLTSLVTNEEVVRSKGNIGGRIFISKSADNKEFLRRIKEVLGKQYPES